MTHPNEFAEEIEKAAQDRRHHDLMSGSDKSFHQGAMWALQSQVVRDMREALEHAQRTYVNTANSEDHKLLDAIAAHQAALKGEG